MIFLSVKAVFLSTKTLINKLLQHVCVFNAQIIQKHIIQNPRLKTQHGHAVVNKLIHYTHGASTRRGLLCSEYPWDSKGKKGSRLRSPFRLCGVALNE